MAPPYAPPSEIVDRFTGLRPQTIISYKRDAAYCARKAGCDFWEMVDRGPDAFCAMFTNLKTLRGRIGCVLRIMRAVEHPLRDAYVKAASDVQTRITLDDVKPARDETIPDIRPLRNKWPLGTQERVYVELAYTGWFRNSEIRSLAFAAHEPEGDVANLCLMPEKEKNVILIQDGKTSSRMGAREVIVSEEVAQALEASYKHVPRYFVFDRRGGRTYGFDQWRNKRGLPPITYCRKRKAKEAFEAPGMEELMSNIDALLQTTEHNATQMGHHLSTHFKDYAGASAGALGRLTQ